MKHWPGVLFFVYVAAGCSLIVPGLVISVTYKLSPPELGSFTSVLPYWLWVVAMVLCQTVLLAVPAAPIVDGPINRRTLLLRRRSILFPILLTGLMIIGLACGAFYSFLEFHFQGELDGNKIAWNPLLYRYPLVFGAALWAGWTVLFYLLNRRKHPAAVAASQRRIACTGCLLELLVALPLFMIARRRTYCFAGWLTSFGIGFGVAVAAFAFGPALLWLYGQRWREWHALRALRREQPLPQREQDWPEATAWPRLLGACEWLGIAVVIMVLPLLGIAFLVMISDRGPLPPAPPPPAQRPLAARENRVLPKQAGVAKGGPLDHGEPGPKAGEVVTNSLGMKLVFIPAGSFTMGEVGRPADDTWPPHPVRITRPFYLGKYEVTKGEFAAFVKATGYKTDAEKAGDFGTWREPSLFLQLDSHPVVCVSWNDAVAFCKWLSQKEGKKHRLPTEAEWEYSCRAGTVTPYHSGDRVESLVNVANTLDGDFNMKLPWNRTRGPDGYIYTAPVGRYKANAFGLHDMHGNASEWCQDWYSADYYKSRPPEDPQGPGAGESRVIRGGSFQTVPLRCRSFDRDGGAPSSRGDHIGFRVLCER